MSQDEYRFVKLSEQVYVVNTWVNAPNAFGATIRTDVHAVFRFQTETTGMTRLEALQIGTEWPVPIPRGGIPE